MTTFEDFWAAYPKRKGSNPKHPAQLKFEKAIKDGTDAGHIISSARRYGEELKEQNKYGTEYVCMAQTWLHQRRWLDYAPDPAACADKEAKMEAFMASKGFKWIDGRWFKPEA